VVRMVNLRASMDVNGSAERLIVAGHYDTKLFHEFSFVGANDGGSSTAFLLELGRVLAAARGDARAPRTKIPIELLFLDGEEALVDWQGTDHTYGSRHYVNAARASGDLKNIRALVLVDMIGERNLRIPRESQSTPWVTEIIWSTAKRLARTEFVDDAMAVEDDHVEFLRAGVPAIDIIDLDYAAWHTADDTLDKVSAASLQAVGDVLLAALPEFERRLGGGR
jgi:glutaminyl-peptide cyclotransferase